MELHYKEVIDNSEVVKELFKSVLDMEKYILEF